MRLETDWSKVKYFKKEEFNEPDKMNPLLVYSLDRLREECGKPIIINSSYRANDLGSTHRNGDAADIVIVGVQSVLDQFFIAEKTRLFSGIGVYPWWNRPGLHVDVRELKPCEVAKRWLRNRHGDYVALTAKNLL